MSAAAGNCDPKKSQVGDNGLCYKYCPEGWSPVDNGPLCAKNCPEGFIGIGSVAGANLACVKPSFPREIKPQLNCPPGADRQYDICLLDCPVGTKKSFNLCVPECPPGFVESSDKLSCQAEFFKRVAVVREACYANETRVSGRFCLSPCPAGTVPFKDNSEMCFSSVPANAQGYFWTGDSNFQSDINPIISKIIFPREKQSATCASDFEALNGQCFSDCPDGAQGLAKLCYADCPSDFKAINNQSACLRPTQKRAIVTSLLGSVKNILEQFFIAVIVVIFGSFFVSRLKF